MRFLTKKVGVPQVDLKVMKSAIFGKDGLAHADSSFVYEERVEAFKRCIEMQKYPQFQKYFDERLNDHILNYVFRPNVIRGSNDLWTNNNSESMNNVLKQVTNWKTLTLPNLINTMSDCIENRLAELKRSLYNSGNYRLQPNYRRFSVPLAEWRVLRETERNEKFLQFLRCDITLEKKYVVSSVLDVKTPAVRRRAEKPNKAKPQVRHKMRKSQISK